MTVDKGKGKNMKADSTAQVRATLSFPPDVYESLKVIAKQKKVSLAWVVREATEQYLSEKWPLFKGQG
jgi:predicted DNA-binding protein